jgi:hypothetical protein
MDTWTTKRNETKRNEILIFEKLEKGGMSVSEREHCSPGRMMPLPLRL